MAKYYKKVEVGKPWQECTKAEYDQLPADQRKIVTDIYNGFVRKKILESETKDVPFVQPILSSNGTLGGNSFAVYSNDTIYAQSNPAYYAVDGNNSTYCAFGIYNYEYIILYNPVPIKISSVTITKNLANGAYYRFSASNDNTNWTILQDEIRSDPKGTITWSFLNNKTSYKYFKLEGKNTSGGNIQIVNIQIEGTIKATIPTRAITMYYNHKRISGYRDYSIKFTDSNIQTVGTLAIDNNGIASGFSNANYCQLPAHLAPSSNWEVNMCVQPHSTATLSTLVNWWVSHAMILGIPNGYYGWVDPVVYTKQPNITMMCTTNSIQIILHSSTYDRGSTKIGELLKTDLTLNSDKFYDIKINFTGTSYIAQYKEHETDNWITLGIINSSTKIGECQLLVGHSYQGITGTGWLGVKEDYFNGKIDLFNSYIKVDNQLWWSNKQEIKSGSIITNYLGAH